MVVISVDAFLSDSQVQGMWTVQKEYRLSTFVFMNFFSKTGFIYASVLDVLELTL